MAGTPKRKPGRPKGSKTKPKVVVPEIEIEEEEDVVEDNADEVPPLKTSGTQLREDIKNSQDRRLLLYKEFDRSKTTFEVDDQRPPLEVLADIENINLRIALLQSFQASYNNRIKVRVPNHPNPLSLTFYIKAVDGSSKELRALKQSLNLETSNRGGMFYDSGHHAKTRNTGDEIETAEDRISDEELLAQKVRVSAIDASYRTAISQGNNAIIDIPEELRFLFE